MVGRVVQHTCEGLLWVAVWPSPISPLQYLFRCQASVSRCVTHYEPTTISAARSLALRARGLTRISCFVGATGFGVSNRKLAL
jgi:hypothetical protein